MTHRPIELWVGGGVCGVLRALQAMCGDRYRGCDVAVDVREGVVESCVAVTVYLAPEEVDGLLDGLRAVPDVCLAQPD